MASDLSQVKSTSYLDSIPLELFRMILDKLYEDSYCLVVVKDHQATTTKSLLPIAPLLLNHHFRSECLDAIKRSKHGFVHLKAHAKPLDLSHSICSPSLRAFLSSVRLLTLRAIPYDTCLIRLWKQTCPNLTNVKITKLYSPTTSSAVRDTFPTSSFVSLLRGDVDDNFASTATSKITSTHPTFQLNDLSDGLSLTIPNAVDFWSPAWEPEYFHENRVLILDLTLTQSHSHITKKIFQNRIENQKYAHNPTSRQLPVFEGVDYDVRYIEEGFVRDFEYDERTNCFVSPYSRGGTMFNRS